ncbi:PLP-dependent aminotransferase family protein [Burkholderia lata]|uniref:Transcriptional regulator, GntR family n=1 Tax=Burkholderia lata (strain ATCC 17760 / DSM 23089 / LMG 22485 / NCIMB 9086 / R18194 / 383) TaxID=482957 RepID=Q39HJ1_BURL3|nr:PLP-dependent aminotransferase family protein [Burkholderia lata]ABB08075.1 transcriptional regulator, GntR family [Burkholderia lata]
METQTSFRYRQLADLIVGMIENGTLAPGTRLPSVRTVSEQQRISVSTALQAYRLLEDLGVLVSRPQSGFYVAAARGGTLALPSTSRSRAKASTVSISGAVAAMLEHAANSALVPLGCAVPDPALLQSKRLDLALARAARQHGTRYNVYCAPYGEPALRREIARRAMRFGHPLSADDILVTNGCTEALTLALNAVATRGDTIAVESPTYFGLLHTLEALGLKALELPTDPLRGVDVGMLAQRLEAESIAACVLSSSFGNPLGSAMSEDDKRALLALLARHRVPLIEDDVYGDIHFGRDRPRPFSALDSGADTIYCSSFSKSLAPGYRIGWIAAGARTQQVMERKLALSLCGPVLLQVAVADFLASGAYDAHLRRIRRVFEDNLARMTRTIEASFPADTKVSRPAGGFVLWLELPKRFDSRALFDAALEQGVCFAPGDIFSASRRFRHCLRLSAGHVWNERIEDGVRCLGRLARAQLAR